MSNNNCPTGVRCDTGDCGNQALASDAVLASEAAAGVSAPALSAAVAPECGFLGCRYVLTSEDVGNRGPYYKHQRECHPGKGLPWLASVRKHPGCPRLLLETAATSSNFQTCTVCFNLAAKNGCPDKTCKAAGAGKARITESMLLEAAAAASTVAQPPRTPPPPPAPRGAADERQSQSGDDSSAESPPPADLLKRHDIVMNAPCTFCGDAGQASKTLLGCECPDDDPAAWHPGCMEDAVLALVAADNSGEELSPDDAFITCKRCNGVVRVSSFWQEPHEFPLSVRRYFFSQSQHDPPDDCSEDASGQSEDDCTQDPAGRQSQEDPPDDRSEDTSEQSENEDDGTQDPADCGSIFNHWTASHSAIMALLPYRDRVLSCIFDTVWSMSPVHADVMARMQIRLFALQEQCVACGDDDGLDAVSIFQYLLPSLLLSPDPSVSRSLRFVQVQELQLTELVERLLTYAENAPDATVTARTDEQSRRLATRTAKQPNGLSRAAEILSGSEPQAPRNQDTVNKLASKYPKQPFENPELQKAIQDAIAAAAAAMSSADPDDSMLFPSEDYERELRSVILGKRLGSASGPDGLRFGHLQLMLVTAQGGELMRRMAHWAVQFFSDQCPKMTPLYWNLHTRSVLSALGTKCRPVSCGNVFRRAVGAAAVRLGKPIIARKFKQRNQSAWDSAGTEKHAFKAQANHDAGKWVLATDVTNAYNSISTLAILDADGLPSIAPQLVRYFAYSHGHNVPVSLFRAEGTVYQYSTETGSQQGCPFGSLFYAAGLSTLTTAADLALGGADESSHLADDGLHFYSGVPTAGNIGQLEQDYARANCTLSRPKSLLLPPAGVEVTDELRAHVAELGVTLVEHGMRVTGSPVGSDAYMQRYLDEYVDATSDPNRLHKLAQQLCVLPDKQVALQLLRHCLAPKAVHLGRTVQPALFVPHVGSKLDNLTLYVLQRILALPATQTQQQCFEHGDPTLAQHHQQQAFLSTKLGGLGLMNLSTTAAPAYVASTYSSCADTFNTDVLPPGDRRDALLQGATTAAQWPSAVVTSVSDMLRQGASVLKLNEVLPKQWVQAASDRVHQQQIPEPSTAAEEQQTALVVDFAAEPPPQRAQAKLAKLLKPARAQQYKAALQRLPSDAEAKRRGVESCNQAVARSLSQSAPEANLYLSGQPYGHTAITGPQMSLALRRHMGIRTSFSSEPCPQHGNNSSYRADSQHADSCMTSGGRAVAHTILCKGLGCVMTEAGVSSLQYENSSCLQGPESRAKIRRRAGKGQHPYCMDIVAAVGSLSGADDPAYRDKELLIDLSARHNTTTSSIELSKSHQMVGAAAAKGEKDKLEHYAGTYTPAAQQLVPFVLETHGRMAPTAKEFLEQLAVHAASRVPCATEQQRKAVKARKLWRYQVVMSATLQRAMSVAEMRYVSRLRDRQRKDVPVLDALWELQDMPAVEQDAGVLPFSVADVLQSGRVGIASQ
jgi:hypothetical protein